MNKDDLYTLAQKLLLRPIAVYPIFVRITQSVTAGYLLSQLVYWADKGKDKQGWIYKTDHAFCQELNMTWKEMRGAKAKLRRQHLVTVQLRGVPATTYYLINWETLIERILAFSV